MQRVLSLQSCININTSLIGVMISGFLKILIIAVFRRADFSQSKNFSGFPKARALPVSKMNIIGGAYLVSLQSGRSARAKIGRVFFSSGILLKAESQFSITFNFLEKGRREEGGREIGFGPAYIRPSIKLGPCYLFLQAYQVMNKHSRELYSTISRPDFLAEKLPNKNNCLRQTPIFQ